MTCAFDCFNAGPARVLGSGRCCKSWIRPLTNLLVILDVRLEFRDTTPHSLRRATWLTRNKQSLKFRRFQPQDTESNDLAITDECATSTDRENAERDRLGHSSYVIMPFKLLLTESQFVLFLEQRKLCPVLTDLCRSSSGTA